MFKKNVVTPNIQQLEDHSSHPDQLPLADQQLPIIDVGAQTLSPNMQPAQSPSCVDEEDDSWMQFITDDAWCSAVSTNEPDLSFSLH